MCCINSVNGIEHFKLKEGAYNGDEFSTFIVECNNLGIFDSDTIIVMDNVKFYHSPNIKNLFDSLSLCVEYLPPYSPDLNPIENLFVTLKAHLNNVKPRATTKTMLMNNINVAVKKIVGGSRNFYRAFWDRIHFILNNDE